MKEFRTDPRPCSCYLCQKVAQRNLRKLPPPLLFFGPSPLPFGGSTVRETYSSTTSRSRPRTGGNRSVASCLCTVLRRALYHYTTRSPASSSTPTPKTSTGPPTRPTKRAKTSAKAKAMCPSETHKETQMDRLGLLSEERMQT